jgi:DUF917 family protein
MEELEKRLRASCYKGVQPRVKVEKRKRDMREEKVQHRLYRSEKDKIQDVSEKNEVRREVRSEHGRVDLMTKDEVVEVKHWKDWKHALGQVKIYGKDWRGKKMRIHLFGFGRPNDFRLIYKKRMIEKMCQEEDVSVSWE